MTDAAALRALIERLEDKGWVGGADPIAIEAFGEKGAMLLQSATTHPPSLDAAVALTERVLPGWGCTIETQPTEFGAPARAYVRWRSEPVESKARSPALALVLATCRAKLAELERA
jgi:hypothetical protein